MKWRHGCRWRHALTWPPCLLLACWRRDGKTQPTGCPTPGPHALAVNLGRPQGHRAHTGPSGQEACPWRGNTARPRNESFVQFPNIFHGVEGPLPPWLRVGAHGRARLARNMTWLPRETSRLQGQPVLLCQLPGCCPPPPAPRKGGRKCDRAVLWRHPRPSLCIHGAWGPWRACSSTCKGHTLLFALGRARGNMC